MTSPGGVVIGVDIGTSSTKAVLVDAAGELLGVARRSHTVSTPRPGLAEMDPVACWWEETADAVRELVARHDGPVAGIAVSGIGPCLAVTDQALTPLRPAILYGIDARAEREIDELERRWGAEELLAVGGSALSSQAVGPKLRWLARNEAETWRSARLFFSASSYVATRLGARYHLDHHTASQYNPMYDLDAGGWHATWAAELAGHLPLPPLVWPGEVVGAITAEASNATGLAVGTPVVAGTVDAWAEALSAGVTQPGDLMLMYGSTLFLVQVTSGSHRHPLLWATEGIRPDQRTLAAGMSTAGTLVEWCAHTTGRDLAELDRQAAHVAPGADGLLLLPYFAGERTPIFDPKARGVVAGLTLQHGPAHLLRAAYEGIAFSLREIISLFDEREPVRRLVAVGGGTQSTSWQQVVSDVTGRAQHVPAQTIGASYGAARLAAEATGLTDSTSWTRTARIVEPEPGSAELYASRIGAHHELYTSTRALIHRMTPTAAAGTSTAGGRGAG